MIRFITGKLEAVSENEIVIENNGIGYVINVPVNVVDTMPAIGTQIKVYTYLNVREDAMQLFGFLAQDDLNVFKLLITVNGIGPKVALGILGFMDANEIRYAVMADDAKAIARAPGIGPKTAGKLILELKDKLKIEDMYQQEDTGWNVDNSASSDTLESQKNLIQDAIEALTVLGYAKTDAAKAVRAVEMTEDMSVEQLLKLSLKKM